MYIFWQSYPAVFVVVSGIVNFPYPFYTKTSVTLMSDVAKLTVYNWVELYVYGM